jgi:2-iminobutanoate/2-iminopropanoate deaminase
MEKSMTQTAIFPSNAPQPIGPYSPAITFGDLVFISGQGPMDPVTQTLVGGGITGQVRQVFTNLEVLLKAAGSSRSQVLKVSVFLQNLDDFQKMNEEYADFFQGCTYPARTTIQAARLPLDILVEIDMIAYRG